MSDSSSSNHKYSKYMWDDQAYSLWTNVSDDREIDSYKCTFVLAMLQENLQHARHVENERITYHGFFAAMVAGALALIAGMADKENRCLLEKKTAEKKNRN